MPRRTQAFKEMRSKVEPPTDDPNFVEETPGLVRIQIRLSSQNYEYLKRESIRTGVSLNSLVGLAVADWVDERRAKQHQSKPGLVDGK